MEPQQNEVKNVVTPLKIVTPVSKYLALGLFILLPFLGGWVGYSYAPEKAIVTPSDQSDPNTWALTNTSTNESLVNGALVTIRTSKNNQTQQLLPIKDYEYNNGSYTVAFSFVSSQIIFTDDYNPGSDDDFYRLSFYKSAKDIGEPLFRYYLHGISGSTTDLTRKVSLLSPEDSSRLEKGTDVEIEDEIWTLLGDYKYCDIGGCDTADYLYTKESGEYRQYILTDIPLHESDYASNDLVLVLKTLQFKEQ
jgi:hypothetical protein